MDALARALAFEAQWLRTLATTVAPVTWDDTRVGEVVLTAVAPHVRDHNTVVLDAASHLDAPSVRAVLDHELGDRGLTHRRLHAPTADAERWRTDLLAHGYEPSDAVVMVWSGTGERGTRTSDTTILEVDRDGAEAWSRTLLAEQAGTRQDVVEEFVRLAGRQHDRGVRFLVAHDTQGEPVGGIRVFADATVAQVEELEVLARHRRRGVAGDLLRAALDQVADRDLVFLTADPDDWPTRWYGRLGLRAVGRSSGFVRVPGDERA